MNNKKPMSSRTSDKETEGNQTKQEAYLGKTGKTYRFVKRLSVQDEIPPASPDLHPVSISRALGIDIVDLFAHTAATVPYQTIVVGRGNEHNLMTRDGTQYGYIYDDLAPNKKGKNMEPFIVTVGFKNDVDILQEFRHEGEEFNYVLEGTLEFFYEGKSHCILQAGDHVYFDADKPHSARSLGNKQARVLIVIYSYKRL